MKGHVTATIYDHLNNVVSMVEGSNMACVGGAEVLVDGLTMSPSLSALVESSAILDTSNYTIHGMSFGKGYDSFDEFAHDIDMSATQVAVTAVQVNTVVTTSSFQTSAVTGILIPAFPHPEDRRLQMASTDTPRGIAMLAVTADVGHNMNAIQFSATNGLGISSIGVGCFPPTGGIRMDYYVTGTFNASNIMKGNFNDNNVMDGSGMLNMTVSSVASGAHVAEYPASGGVWMTSLLQGVSATQTSASFSSSDGRGQIGYNAILSGGDFALPNAYGGIYAIGLWCIDTKAMLASGITPPFSFTALNNTRLYKLFAKKVFTRDLTFAQDSGKNGIINKFSTPYEQFGVGEPGETFKSKIQWRLSF